ncbi:MAG: GEVED domain-containing protein [Chloroflexota bacterium]|nr:GEVED domain-containing protein [Chloroflexota bacterium]
MQGPLKAVCLMMLLGMIIMGMALPPASLADWNIVDGHKMLEPKLPDPYGYDVRFDEYPIGDDWQCTESGEVSDIHFWMSWQGDIDGIINAIDVQIYDHNEGPPEQPGNLLWSRVFGQGEFTVRENCSGDQKWYDPNEPPVIENDHLLYYQVNIMDIDNPFYQEQDNTYWLVLKIDNTGGQAGWKTAQNQSRAVAVYYDPFTEEWVSLIDSMNERSLDLSFVINEHSAPDPSSKWLQKPGFLQYEMSIQADNADGYQRVVADDFLCTETSLLTDVHFWGTWYQDMIGTFTNIHLSIHSDDQTGEYSKPGELLWEMDFTEYGHSFGAWTNQNQLWDPITGAVDMDQTLHRYDVYIDPADAFLQEGTPDNPIIYWLDIGVETGFSEFGWKVRDPYEGHFEDDAVYLDTDGQWKELRYPGWHPLEGDSVDMAFELTFEPMDFGDAPDSQISPGYPTLLANNGARHVTIPNVYMGNMVDPEPDGQPNANASGDDILDMNDDEDGVVFTSPLIPGQNATVTVTASVPGFLNAWVDFNADIDWSDQGEQIFNNTPLLAGPNNLQFFVPASTLVGQTTFARFRFDQNGSLPYDGPASGGEVEDYPVNPTSELPAIVLFAIALTCVAGYVGLRKKRSATKAEVF